MNILILSAGSRNKIIQYFKNALAGNGRVIATDMNHYAPALYDADKFYTVPPITAENYINVILDICANEHVTGVLSLIDPELELLAKHKGDFERIGVQVIGSSEELCCRAMDKMEMFRWLSERGYRCGKSYRDKKVFYSDVEAGVINFPVFVKPIRGSASISVNEVFDNEELDSLFEKGENLMIQEYLNKKEIGADVYIDMISGEVVSIFTKRKIKMRAGETDKAVSFKDERLFSLIERFVKECGFSGPIDIDLFEINGEYYISEVNPRFGGGYPHAYECGIDFMSLICNNLSGEINDRVIGEYPEGVIMMKYNEIKILKK